MELEFVLEHRQVLIALTVVAILLGGLFAIGYEVGRGSAPTALRLLSDSSRGPAASGSTSQPNPEQASSRASPGSEITRTTPDSTVAATADRAGQSHTDAVPKPGTQIARLSTENVLIVLPNASLQVGTYLQVVAVKRLDAEAIAGALQNEGLPVVLTASSIEGLFRVLVGPFQDATSLRNAQTELENLGFRPIVQRTASKG